MEGYTAAADKLINDIDHLERVIDGDPTEARIELALAIAKRARRDATLLVQALARHRDQLQPKEGTSS